MYGVSQAPQDGWTSGSTIARLAVAVVLLLAFLVIETRVKDPLMPFRIFSVRTVAGANVAGLLLGAVVFANFFLLTLYVQQVQHWSALKTGLTFIATAGTAIGSLTISGPGSTLNLAGRFTLAQVQQIAYSQTAVTLSGTLDNRGTTLALKVTDWP